MLVCTFLRSQVDDTGVVSVWPFTLSTAETVPTPGANGNQTPVIGLITPSVVLKSALVSVAPNTVTPNVNEALNKMLGF